MKTKKSFYKILLAVLVFLLSTMVVFVSCKKQKPTEEEKKFDSEIVTRLNRKIVERLFPAKPLDEKIQISTPIYITDTYIGVYDKKFNMEAYEDFKAKQIYLMVYNDKESYVYDGKYLFLKRIDSEGHEKKEVKRLFTYGDYLDKLFPIPKKWINSSGDIDYTKASRSDIGEAYEVQIGFLLGLLSGIDVPGLGNGKAIYSKLFSNESYENDDEIYLKSKKLGKLNINLLPLSFIPSFRHFKDGLIGGSFDIKLDKLKGLYVNFVLKIKNSSGEVKDHKYSLKLPEFGKNLVQKSDKNNITEYKNDLSAKNIFNQDDYSVDLNSEKDALSYSGVVDVNAKKEGKEDKKYKVHYDININLDALLAFFERKTSYANDKPHIIVKANAGNVASLGANELRFNLLLKDGNKVLLGLMYDRKKYNPNNVYYVIEKQYLKNIYNTYKAQEDNNGVFKDFDELLSAPDDSVSYDSNEYYVMSFELNALLDRLEAFDIAQGVQAFIPYLKEFSKETIMFTAGFLEIVSRSMLISNKDGKWRATIDMKSIRQLLARYPNEDSGNIYIFKYFDADSYVLKKNEDSSVVCKIDTEIITNNKNKVYKNIKLGEIDFSRYGDKYVKNGSTEKFITDSNKDLTFIKEKINDSFDIKYETLDGSILIFKGYAVRVQLENIDGKYYVAIYFSAAGSSSASNIIEHMFLGKGGLKSSPEYASVRYLVQLEIKD